jgi:hypothetical protein
MVSTILRVLISIIAAAWMVGSFVLFPALAIWLWKHDAAPLWGQILGSMFALILTCTVAWPLALIATLPLAWAWDPEEFRKGMEPAPDAN